MAFLKLTADQKLVFEWNAGARQDNLFLLTGALLLGLAKSRNFYDRAILLHSV